MGNHRHRVEAVEMAEGTGARVKRLFPTQHLTHRDPFVLLDEFFVVPSAGFPSHPHRGFEAITYMLEGSFHHEDSAGHHTDLLQGGVQRFTAGRGIVHSEMPGKSHLNHGFQLWVNLPRRLKGIEPSYQQVEPDAIPEAIGHGWTILTIVGEGSPVDLKTDVLYLDIRLQADSRYNLSIPEEFVGFAYLYQGELKAGEVDLKPGEGLLLEGGERLPVQTRTGSRFLAVSGRPHGEPIHLHGSFVD